MSTGGEQRGIEATAGRASMTNAQAQRLLQRVRRCATGMRLLAAVPAVAEPAAEPDSATMLHCDELWREIDRIYHETVLTPEAVKPTHRPYTAILRARAAQAEAELTALLETPIAVPGTDAAAVKSRFESDLKSQIEQLDQGLRRLARERDELQAELQEEKAITEEHQEIQAVLAQRAEAAVQLDRSYSHVASQADQEQATQKTMTQTNRLNRENRQLMIEMTAFMNKYFPQPSADEVAAEAKRAKTLADFFPETQPLQLNSFLEDLMNESIASPANPYITLTRLHWQPYVELLLRTGIAVLHPRDPSRIKLVEFHT